MKSPRLTNLTAAVISNSGFDTKSNLIISTLSYRTVLCLVMMLCALSPFALAQGWNFKKDMSVFRDGFGAATGPDGKIYAIGGRNNGGYLIGSVDVYDPIKDTWTLNTTSDFTPRAFMATVTGRDGYIYTFGGLGGTKVVQRFDVSTKKFTALQNLPFDMSRGIAAVMPDGKIYVMGASTYKPTELMMYHQFDQEWIYDPSNDSWQVTPEWSGGGEDGVLFTGIDGKVYLTSKWGDTRSFDGATWTWLDPYWGNYSSLVRFAGTTGSDGTLFLLGGNIDSGSVWPRPSESAMTLGQNDSMWNSIAPMNTRHTFFGASTAEGRVYAFGGWHTNGGNPHPLENWKTEMYDKALPTPRFTSGGTNNVNGTSNVAALFRFDQVTGTQTPDDSGNNLTANLMLGPPHNKLPKSDVAGRVNKAIEFNIDDTGKNKNMRQHVKVDDNLAINFGTGSFAFDAWVKFTWDWTGVLSVIDKRVPVTGGYRGYHVFIYSGQKLGLQLAVGSNYANYLSSQSIPLAKNTDVLDGWTHIAISVDRTSANPKARFYINGVLTDEVTPLAGDVGDGVNTKTGPLLIGGNSISGMPFFGSLDEVTLYSRALNWAEIRAIFLAGKVGKQ